MDAVVIAGGVPQPGEPLYPYTQGQPKALLDVCGKPMAQWVLDALTAAPSIDRVLIAGLEDLDGLSCPKLAGTLPNQGSLLQNMQAGAKYFLALGEHSSHVAVVSSDIPAILPEHVEWVVQTAMQTDLDAYYNVIARPVMEKRYPDSRRTYTRMKDVEVCGGDLNVVRAQTLTGNDALWEQIIASRKNPLKQAAMIGYGTLFWLLLGRLTLQNAVERVAHRLNLTGQALLCPYAEVGMDVDKPHQLDMMRQDLGRRG